MERADCVTAGVGYNSLAAVVADVAWRIQAL